ncbi:1-phosphofructokinase family hexose kinase [Bacillus canaveralius]|uniref:1-phosphofructokinase family hexose kinase n=1 Tax=Bacillus canaveralius TaxID=1403243 RepID=UPI000F7B3D88|nr:1-phosphofructokinase family hexose kinase [Bacillus canaveralius]RSK54621.1 1-phosphofructokinase family hexose kinase [Bacillus canaveralius]
MIYTVTLNTAIDRIVHIDGILTRKHNNKTKSISLDIGGKATHVSIVLSSLNILNIATGFVGDLNKDILYTLLEEKNVIYDFVSQKNSAIRETLVLIDNSGKGSYMITEQGFEISNQSYNRLLEKFDNCVKENDIVVFAGGPPKGVDIQKYKELLLLIKRKQGRLVVDAADEYLKTAVEIKPYLIKPNELEFQELIGHQLQSISEYTMEIRKLLNYGIEYVVVSLGKNGSLVGHQNNIYKITPPKIREVNDTGCGDVFLGGIVAQLFANQHPEDIFRFATALSASKAELDKSSSFSLEKAEAFLNDVIIQKIEEVTI